MTDLTAFPTLATARLRLREIVADDAPALLAIHGDPQLMRWFGSDPITDLDAAQGLVRAFASWRTLVNPGTRWGIERHDRPGLCGSVGLFSWNRQWRRCTVGYELAQGAQGQGLMREALGAVLPWGWTHMQLHRIEALIHPDNLPSIRLVRGLGFTEEGRLREVGRWGGRHHDMLQFSLLRHEWATVPVGPGDGDGAASIGADHPPPPS
jgi:[ribosomal protein S5]-alanine N-acetyltransferase